jgi:hypothetical protein
LVAIAQARVLGLRRARERRYIVLLLRAEVEQLEQS